MTSDAVETPATHITAQTQFVETAGARFAHRRFGRLAEAPLVMLQHLRGNLDNWDPALTDALAAERELILLDYPALAASMRAAWAAWPRTAIPPRHRWRGRHQPRRAGDVARPAGLAGGAGFSDAHHCAFRAAGATTASQ